MYESFHYYHLCRCMYREMDPEIYIASCRSCRSAPQRTRACSPAAKAAQQTLRAASRHPADSAPAATRGTLPATPRYLWARQTQRGSGAMRYRVRARHSEGREFRWHWLTSREVGAVRGLRAWAWGTGQSGRPAQSESSLVRGRPKRMRVGNWPKWTPCTERKITGWGHAFTHGRFRN